MEKNISKKWIDTKKPNRPQTERTIQIKIEQNPSNALLKKDFIEIEKKLKNQNEHEKKNTQPLGEEMVMIQSEPKKVKKGFNPLGFLKSEKKPKEDEVLLSSENVQHIQEKKEVIIENNLQDDLDKNDDAKEEIEGKKKSSFFSKKEQKEIPKGKEEVYNSVVEKQDKGELLFCGMTAQDLYIEYRRLQRSEKELSKDLIQDIDVKKQIIKDLQMEINEIYQADVDTYEGYLMKENVHPKDSYFQKSWNSLGDLWRVRQCINKLQPNPKHLQNEIEILLKKIVEMELELEQTEMKIEKSKKESADRYDLIVLEKDKMEKDFIELKQKAERMKSAGLQERSLKEQEMEKNRLLEQQIKILEQEKEQAKNEVIEKAMGITLEEMEIKERNWNQEIQKKDSFIEQLELQIKKLTETLTKEKSLGNDWQETIKEKDRMIVQLRDKIHLLTNSLQQMEVDKNHQKNHDDLNIIIQEKEETIVQLEKQLKSAKDELTVVEQDKDKYEKEKTEIQQNENVSFLLKHDYVNPKVKKQLYLLLKERTKNESVTVKNNQENKVVEMVRKEESDPLKSSNENDVQTASRDVKNLILTMKENQNGINIHEEMLFEQKTEEKKSIKLFKKHGYEIQEEKPNEYYIIEPETRKKAYYLHLDKPIKDEEEYENMFKKCNLLVLTFANREDKKMSNRSLGKWLNKQTDTKKREIQFSLNSEQELMQKPPEKLGGV